MTDFHWEAITPLMRQVLRTIGQSSLCPRFYLAGGTALALYLGHRRSVDLDFFSETDEVRPDTHAEALRILRGLHPSIVEQAWGNLVLIVNGLRIGFFSYGYPLVAPTGMAEGVPLASLADIGLMKMDAIATRASRKDFYDLYAIAQHIPLHDLLTLALQKYPQMRDFEARVLRYLVYFERAETEEDPFLLQRVPWSSVVAFFREQVMTLGKRWWT